MFNLNYIQLLSIYCTACFAHFYFFISAIGPKHRYSSDLLSRLYDKGTIKFTIAEKLRLPFIFCNNLTVFCSFVLTHYMCMYSPLTPARSLGSGGLFKSLWPPPSKNNVQYIDQSVCIFKYVMSV